MGAFNTLLASLECESCKRQFDAEIQFKYGELWQYTYRLGDMIRWGRRNEGVSGCKSVVLSGTGDDCPGCGNETEVLIFLQDNVMMRVVPDHNEYDFAASNGYYVVIEV